MILLLYHIACDGGGTEAPGGGAGPWGDTGKETGVDTAVDTAADSGADTGCDSGLDSATDSGADTASETPVFVVTLVPTENPLARRIAVVTVPPASVVVTYGDELAAWRMESPLGQEHLLLALGLPAEATTRFYVEATDEAGNVSATELELATGALPHGVFSAAVVIPDADPTPAFTLINTFVQDGDLPPAVEVLDRFGRVVWYHQYDGGITEGAVDAQITGAGDVLIGGSIAPGEGATEVQPDGTAVWSGPTQPGYFEDGYDHHSTTLLADNTVLSLEASVRDGVRGDRIVQRNRAGDLLWSWDAWDHWERTTPGTSWTHCNAVERVGGLIWLSERNSSYIWKINASTGATIWSLGADGDFSLAPGGHWFEQQHDPQRLAGNHMLIYDNGTTRGWSRVVEYALDEASLQAREVWSWNGGAEWHWYSDHWGSVQRLADGGTLIGAGTVNVARIMEVNPDDSVRWALQLPTSDAERVGFYRARRFDPGVWGMEAVEGGI